MLQKVLERQGKNHRRWGILAVLVLAPFATYAFTGSGWMTARLGPLVEQRWDLFALGLALTGLALRVYMAGYGQAAEPGQLLPKGPLRTEGLYSIVRHPVVLANSLILLSATLLFKSMFFTVLVLIVACLYYERLMLAKERILHDRHGEEFTAWALATPLILPRLSLWKKPSESFDGLLAIRREAVTFAFIGVLFFTLETLEGVLIDGLPFWEWALREPHWLSLFAISTIIFAAQLSRAWAIVALFLFSTAAAVVYSGFLLPARLSDSERALQALRAGGHVLLLRHAETDSQQDAPDVRLQDCSTQRNLSGEGREQARALGKILRERGVDLIRTVSSEYCRARETADLLGAETLETMPQLNERRLHITLFERLWHSSGEDESVLRPVRALIAGWKEQGTLLLVSHAPVINGLAFTGVGMGEGLVLKPAPALPMGFTIVGKISQPAALPR